MFPKPTVCAIAVLIGWLGICAVGCNDSSRNKENGNMPVSPQTITLPSPGNPFRPDTEIVFVMPQTGNWSASIANIFGDTVRNFSDISVEGETVWIIWEGNNDYGAPQPDGIYYVRVTAGKYLYTKKLLLLWRP